jgi:hypothetical protein
VSSIPTTNSIRLPNSCDILADSHEPSPAVTIMAEYTYVTRTYADPT